MPDWPHAPVHQLDEEHTFIVTAGTYRKLHHLNTPARLQLVHDALLVSAAEAGWELQAWAVLANHYHFVAIPRPDARPLKGVISELHKETAGALNRMDGARGRQVWFQFWDTRLTYQRSYLARLRYVNENPVHHGVVQDATKYPWCSAAWFERTADAAFRKTVNSFKIDQLRVYDDF
ncbi:MAG: hypothetical protein FJ290_11570 [Planctomycetes bacterium]|nr:hypothetical protein [Planctomycetota bacterium]